MNYKSAKQHLRERGLSTKWVWSSTLGRVDVYLEGTRNPLGIPETTKDQEAMMVVYEEESAEDR